MVQNQGVPQDVRVAGFGRTLARAGYQVEIIAPARSGQSMKEAIDGYAVHRFTHPPEGPGVWGYTREVGVSLWRIRKAWPEARPTRNWCILHLCNPPDVLWTAFTGSSRRLVRIFDQHDLAPELYFAKGGRPGSIPHRAVLSMERLAYRWADFVLVPNESYARIAMLRGRVPHERIHVVRNAPDVDIWHPTLARRDLREGADFVVCYVGAIGTQDGVDELIRTMAWVRQADPHRKYLCLVVGSGDAVAELKELTRSSHLEDCVRFLGWISDARIIRDIVASSDVGVEPCSSNSFNDSSTMIKLTEYLAAGRPVLAYDLPEHRVTVGEAGVLVPSHMGFPGLGAALIALARDPVGLGRLAERAGRRLDEAGLSAARSTEALLQVYARARALGSARGALW